MNKDIKWMEGIKNRNPKVISEVYKEILPGITNWVKKNNGNVDDAKDLFQEMLVAVYKKVQDENFKLTCTFWSFALVICRNLWFARLRKSERIEYVQHINDEEVVLDGDIVEHIENQDKMALYRKHFATLDEKCQKVLSMFFEKVKLKLIAEKLATTEAYIKKKKFKCKEALVNRIQEDPLFLELRN